MSSELAIRARRLCKTFQVYEQPEDRLKQMIWRGRRCFYREFPAVVDIDLDVSTGETVGIVGRNGSGKSTLLKMICGLLEPSSGSIEVRGHIAPLLTIGTGFNPEFSGRENVVLSAALSGFSEREISERFGSIVEFAEIGDFLDQPVRSYSSGMVARLAFAVAIHAEPEILVIDEVLAVGDEAFTRKCFARIDEIKKAGSTILFVSHALNRVVELCDRAVLMEAGRRILSADPKTVVSQYHRLANATAREAPKVLGEIEQLDAGKRDTNSQHFARESPGNRAPDRHADAAIGDRGEARPQSSVEYQPRGARIEAVRILDLEGRPVDLLDSGGWYQYCLEARFSASTRGVRFGMMLKLPTGFEFGGQVSHSPGEGLDYVEEGTVVRVRFHFVASLVPGVYFGNAGILGLVDSEEQYLHRVLDALAFRVVGPTGRVTGRVDLTQGREAEIELTRP